MNIVASMTTHPNMAFIAVLGDGAVLKNVTFQGANVIAYPDGNGGVRWFYVDRYGFTELHCEAY